MMDATLDMLRAMRLTGGIFLDAEFTAPWCITAQVGPKDCAPFMAEPRCIIAYHYVTAGALLLKVASQKPVAVAAGEIVVLPRNDVHVVGSALNIRPVSAERLIKSDPDGGLAQIRHGGGGERTRLLCGFLGNDVPGNPLIAMLPSVLTLNVDSAAGSWIESSFRYAGQKLGQEKVSSPAVLGRLAELLFMEAVRQYLAAQPPGSQAWIAGMGDPAVARALGLLHGQLARHWTTEDLARETGLSRSAFAERFTKLIGEPPMRYLALQRLAKACTMLRETADPIARIAYEVGYESEAAFNRAFRREYDTPPSAWRKARK